jgi:hypothetical protein
MLNCKNCTHWADESLAQIEADHNANAHLFMGCRIFGTIDINRADNCEHYKVSEDLFTLCNSCGIAVPKVCVSLGECVNCTDTDLFCVEQCIGEDSRKYCTHFVRLHTEGVQLIDHDQVFDLFPILGMPGKEKPPEPSSPDTRQNSQSGDNHPVKD